MTNQFESTSPSTALYYCPPPLVLHYGANLEAIERDCFQPGEDDDPGGSLPIGDPLAETFALPTTVAKSNADQQYEMLRGGDRHPAELKQRDQLIVTGPDHRMAPTGSFRLTE